jgi:ADP-L-glycero-D-manno-heptose 6-epimerase
VGIYNIGTGTPSTWNQLARSVFGAMKRDPQIEYIPMPTDLLGRYQDYTCADMHKFQSLYNKSHGKPYSFYSLSDGVKDCVQNYVEKDVRW